MGLFDFMNKKKQQSKEFILAEHFRGFKSFPMIVHGDSESEQNNKFFKDANMPGKTILFIDEDPKRISIHIDGKKVGTLFDDDCIKKVRNDAFDKVYAKVETETVVEKKGTVTRPRIKLFVHYKE